MNPKPALIQISLVSALLVQAITSVAQPVTRIAAGDNHSLFLKSDGSLWAMGNNVYGQLGDGTTTTSGPYGVSHPEQIVASNVTAIAAGSLHTLFLKSDGSLWAMGNNAVGQLGDGTTNDVNVPEQIVASNVTAIATANYHSLFLKSDGSLWYMGDTFFDAVNPSLEWWGPGYPQPWPYYYTTIPQQIVSGGVTAIAAGYDTTLFLKSDGSLWGMSAMFDGGNPHSAIVPEQIAASGVTTIAAGTQDLLYLMSDGSLWGMGDNSAGQLGIGVSYTNSPTLIFPAGSGITAIASDVTDTIFLKSDGSLWGMGESSDGQLGVGPGTFYSPVQIVSGGVTSVAAGNQFTLFTKGDGSLWGMGYNYGGQLGLGDNNPTGGINPSSFWLPVPIVAAYNQIFGQLLATGDMQLSFVGIAGGNYALDRSFSLSPANWIPQATNQTVGVGTLVFTSTPDPTTNNFWRIRSVP
ncbi:MAG: hypothetical protein WAO02_10180 [Verrucomicrobiia bacterium]